MNRLLTTALALMSTLALHGCAHAPASPDDPYLWLEELDGTRALDWVRERNAASRAVLEQHPRFASLRTRMLDVLDSREKIPYVARRGDWLFNFWQDAQHPRGLWRRTTLAEYRKPDPAWETLLDLDALARAENENWVWKGSTCFGAVSAPGRSPADSAPSGGRAPQGGDRGGVVYTRCMLSLSRGGADATVLREYDIAARRFVEPEDGGFALPEAKGSVQWLDADTLAVRTNFGPGTMTDSGYPRVVKRWRRGTPLAEAALMFEGRAKDVSAFVSVDRTPGFERVIVGRSIDFYNTEQWLLRTDGTRVRIEVPSDAQVHFRHERLLVELRSDWTVGERTYPRGALLATDAVDFLAGEREFTVLFTPTPTRSLESFATTRGRLLLTLLDNVAGRLEEWTPPSGSAGRWQRRDVAAPSPGALSVQPLHDPLMADDALAEHYLLSYTDFLTPDSLRLRTTGSDASETLKARPAFFDADGMRVEQRFATSKDGTRVPYFVVWPKGATADGRNPTLLYGYGGFEISMRPWYASGFGTSWYGQGGVLVVANIRGGGEFGPAWHRAATGPDKQKSFDDFIAVAEDLVAAGITSPRHLGIEGGSNGGLLVGAVMLQRPDLFGAVVCQVPLLDMRRYHRLLAGASWMAEYGDPDVPEQWAFISAYSPYQNVRTGVTLPPVLLTTSTRDDRVHPGHARKMAARLQALGHEVLYYENIEGGHAGAADNRQRAEMWALEFAFLWGKLAR